ncbi:hypothetical protein CEUSTIGMA_g11014.t1 [Chlamydomonas eustigma]|uniref:Uncharacterized protein n=1 Tax=Chlamydomonas eustigma TaxID=1157962 RepID=A0A250XKZ6_9CHLO|nr:hypothetical protein CEUSTIGMA_g11014.t1 [Chlamydomonas eustigma]|eukprot:GAX83589.1 hypothetical protein CEUSTIGMA_g11014.t1 [Chlamydomonas eustigma]
MEARDYLHNKQEYERSTSTLNLTTYVLTDDLTLHKSNTEDTALTKMPAKLQKSSSGRIVRPSVFSYQGGDYVLEDLAHSIEPEPRSSRILSKRELHVASAVKGGVKKSKKVVAKVVKAPIEEHVEADKVTKGAIMKPAKKLSAKAAPPASKSPAVVTKGAATPANKKTSSSSAAKQEQPAAPPAKQTPSAPALATKKATPATSKAIKVATAPTPLPSKRSASAKKAAAPAKKATPAPAAPPPHEELATSAPSSAKISSSSKKATPAVVKKSAPTPPAKKATPTGSTKKPQATKKADAVLSKPKAQTKVVRVVAGKKSKK